MPFIFLVKEKEITNSLEKSLDKDSLNTEEVIDIVYQQQAVFRVRPVARCTRCCVHLFSLLYFQHCFLQFSLTSLFEFSSSMPGHAEAVISVRFSPNGKLLASGSGDTTVRMWDIATQTPHMTCTGMTVVSKFGLSHCP